MNSSNKVYSIHSEENFNDILKKALTYNKIVFIKFTATWCAPCKKIEPYYQKIAEYCSSCIFISVDIDKCNEIKNRFNIKSVPTFFVFKNNEFSELMIGTDTTKLYNEIKKQII